MTNKTTPPMTEGGHIGSESDDEQTSGVSPPTATTAITGNTAGVDEADPSLRSKDELDSWAGDEPSEDQSSESNPQGSSTEDPLPDSVEWLLPQDSDDNGGRTGLLSTHTEVHAFVIGLTAGAHFGLDGDPQILNDILGLSITSDRARRAQRIPQKYRDQAKQEMPYFVVGAALGTGLTRANALAELGVGV